MPINYAQLQLKTASILKNFGSTATIKRQNSNVNWPTPCVLVFDKAQDSTVSGSVYLTARTITAFVGNTKDVPSPGDQLVMGAQTYNIDTVQQYMPDGVTNLCWQLELTI
jgi:hypothetical protein